VRDEYLATRGRGRALRTLRRRGRVPDRDVERLGIAPATVRCVKRKAAGRFRAGPAQTGAPSACLSPPVRLALRRT
jgi:hypothetical protein